MPDFNSYSDQHLLLLLKQGDHCAFSEIYHRCWAQLYKTAYQRLKDKEVCKDIIHDVFADLWNKCASKNIDNLQAYLHTAVRYKIYTWLAKGNNTAHFVEPFDSMALSPYDADSWFREYELNHLVTLWMETLPHKRKVIFKLKYHENLSTKAISNQLNISQKTVQNQLLISVSSLKEYLAHYMAILIIFCAIY